MNNSIMDFPIPKNEPVLDYLPNSNETRALKAELAKLSSTVLEIGPVINGKVCHTGKIVEVRAPHKTDLLLAKCHMAGPSEIARAIEGAKGAWRAWSETRYEDRAAVFLKAAELLTTKYRYKLNAATMLGQSKTCHQAEIDSACELIDFLRFNTVFQEEIYSVQPLSTGAQSNRIEYRALEGFVFAVTPFNFTAIAGNLPTSAALMGNAVLWKPATTALLSGYFIMELLKEAGLPDGVIQFVPGSGAAVGGAALAHTDLAGIHFTGSTGVFQQMWSTVGQNIAKYKNYPRIVGETGGKDFVFAHPSADIDVLVTSCLRGAFEYQGQKCSAASRAYIPKSLAPQFRERLLSEIATIKQGDVADFRNFMGAVIDESSYENISGDIEQARKDASAKVLCGGKSKDTSGYFILPTLIEATDPAYRTLCEEIFGPVLSFYVYDDNRFEDTLKICDSTSPYALTGSIISQDRNAIIKASKALEHAAGNFYINNKPTGAVVGQQPFGGSRASGTNDKAGSIYNLLRWTSMRTVSETYAPPTNYRYPFLA
jgi:1-pyrroline-5-carboxylate dehydrogenase